MKRLLLDSTSPLTNFQSWLNTVNGTMKIIGPAVGTLSIAICVLLICFSDIRESKAQVRKIVTICIAIAVLANSTLIINFATSLIADIFA